MTVNGAEPIETPKLDQLIAELEEYVDNHQPKNKKKGILQFGLKDTIAKNEAASITKEALVTIKSILIMYVKGISEGMKLSTYEIQGLNKEIKNINTQIGALSKIKEQPFNSRLNAVITKLQNTLKV